MLSVRFDGVGGSVLGEGTGQDLQLIERVDQPQRHGVERLDFHDAHLRVGDAFAVAAGREVEVGGAVAHVLVEGDAQVAVGLAVERRAVVGDEHLGLESLVVAHRPINLAHDLGVDGSDAGFEVAHRVAVAQRFAPLINNAVVFLLQLKEHLAVRVGGGVAAKPKLFFIYRLVERAADQAVIVGVEVQAAHGAFAVFVLTDVLVNQLEKPSALAEGDDVFGFGSFKNGLDVHDKTPFLCLWLYCKLSTLKKP